MRLPDEAELLLPPRERLRLAVAEDPHFARRCGDLLRGQDDPEAMAWLGARAAATWGHSYWFRVWPLRGLLYTWDEQVTGAVLAQLGDEAWRVREMACKVVRLRELPAADLLDDLLADPVPRVRLAAVRALAVVGESDSADAVRRLLDDEGGAVAEAAETALRTMSRRLDRDLS